jgi:hypothetical protein
VHSFVQAKASGIGGKNGEYSWLNISFPNTYALAKDLSPTQVDYVKKKNQTIKLMKRFYWLNGLVGLFIVG